MEMAFADEETIMGEIESLISHIWRETSCATPLAAPFARMTYQEAMSSYGSDKPDLRYTAKVRPRTILSVPY